MMITPNLTTCSNYAYGFQYSNPFIMGYSVYFNSMVFELLNNKTNVYPCSGIIGYAFTASMDLFMGALLDEKMLNLK